MKTVTARLPMPYMTNPGDTGTTACRTLCVRSPHPRRRARLVVPSLVIYSRMPRMADTILARPRVRCRPVCWRAKPGERNALTATQRPMRCPADIRGFCYIGFCWSGGTDKSAAKSDQALSSWTRTAETSPANADLMAVARTAQTPFAPPPARAPGRRRQGWVVGLVDVVHVPEAGFPYFGSRGVQPQPVG